MSDTTHQRLAELGITLPDVPLPAGNYVPFIRHDNLIYISGQISMVGSEPIRGKLGADFDLNSGVAAARVCAINIVAQLDTALDGALDTVQQVVRLGGFVNATADFTQHPQVINGASDLIAQVFGERGVHARAAVGCSSLPLGVAVEVEGLFAVK